MLTRAAQPGLGSPEGVGSHPPGHDNGFGVEASLQNLVPPDQLLPVIQQELVDSADKPGLQ